MESEQGESTESNVTFTVPDKDWNLVNLPVFFKQGGTAEEDGKKADRYFGGAKCVQESINKRSSDNPEPLTFSLRPNDALSHPIVGETKPACGVLVKVTVKKDKKTGKETVRNVIPMGRVVNEISFNDLAGFQYLPPIRHEQNKIANSNQISIDFNIAQREVTRSEIDTSQTQEDDAEDSPADQHATRLGSKHARQQFSNLFLPPSHFADSNKYHAGRFIFQRGTSTHVSKSIETSITWDLFDQSPPPIQLPQSHPLRQWQSNGDESQQALDTAVAHQFDIRPAWRAVDLYNTLLQEKPESDLKLEEMKKMMGCHAYRMNKGPWRGVYLKFSYDPRSDKMSRVYQVLETRRKRSTKPRTTYSRIRKSSNVTGEKSTMQNKLRDGYMVCGVKYLPARYNTWQLCDIRDEELRARIKAPRPSDAVLDPKYGWFTEDDFDRFRAIVTTQVLKVLNNKASAGSENEVAASVDEVWEDQPLPRKFWFSDTEVNPPKSVLKPTESIQKKRRTETSTTVEDGTEGGEQQQAVDTHGQFDGVEGFAVFDDDDDAEDNDDDDEDDSDVDDLQPMTSAQL